MVCANERRNRGLGRSRLRSECVSDRPQPQPQPKPDRHASPQSRVMSRATRTECQRGPLQYDKQTETAVPPLESTRWGGLCGGGSCMRIACSKIAAGRRSGIKKQQPERLIPVGGGRTWEDPTDTGPQPWNTGGGGGPWWHSCRTDSGNQEKLLVSRKDL